MADFGLPPTPPPLRTLINNHICYKNVAEATDGRELLDFVTDNMGGGRGVGQQDCHNLFWPSKILYEVAFHYEKRKKCVEDELPFANKLRLSI